MGQPQGSSTILTKAAEEVRLAATLDALEQVRVKYLGRKGALTAQLREVGGLAGEERRQRGQELNKIKISIEEVLSSKQRELSGKTLGDKLSSSTIDITLPGQPFPLGSLHPLTETLAEMGRILERLGFSLREGPDMETEFNNFEALNIPRNHPARDLQDTFYLKSPGMLLRTHTSPVQVRVMLKEKPPLRIYAPGRVYRRENIDASHSCVFHQVEGLAVDRDVTFPDLKAALTAFAREFFGPDIPVRLRPGYFPFVEPGAELDVGCRVCMGKGCPLCKNSGWLEVLGAGMVHPNVFKSVGIDPRKFSGFAFGMGAERLAMLKYRINDMRLFFENDVRFLEQLR